jgi:hypothetical protein
MASITASLMASLMTSLLDLIASHRAQVLAHRSDEVAKAWHARQLKAARAARRR